MRDQVSGGRKVGASAPTAAAAAAGEAPRAMRQRLFDVRPEASGPAWLRRH